MHYRALRGTPKAGTAAEQIGSKVYFDLATWHLINTVYAPGRVAELQGMKSFYADLRQHTRLMDVIAYRLGHGLIGRAEAAKIAVAEGGATTVDLGLLEPGLAVTVDETDAVAAIAADLARIAVAADETLMQAGIDRARVDALYFTGGSTGFLPLAQTIAARFPQAQVVRGNRFSSVAQGLGVHAQRLYG